MPTASIAESTPRPSGQLENDVANARHGLEVDGLDAVPGGHGEALGHPVDAHHPPSALMPGDTCAHLADRPEAPHADGGPGLHVGVRHCLPCRRQHVGEVEEAVIGRPVGYFDRPEVRLGDS